MTNEQLKEIKALVTEVKEQKTPYWQASKDQLAFFHCPALIAEVERMQSELTKADAHIDELEMEKQDAESWTQDIYNALKTKLPPCDDDPMDEGYYAKQVVEYVRDVVAENERLQELVEAYRWHDECRTLLATLPLWLTIFKNSQREELCMSIHVAEKWIAELEAKGGAE